MGIYLVNEDQSGGMQACVSTEINSDQDPRTEDIDNEKEREEKASTDSIGTVDTYTRTGCVPRCADGERKGGGLRSVL